MFEVWNNNHSLSVTGTKSAFFGSLGRNNLVEPVHFRKHHKQTKFKTSVRSSSDPTLTPVQENKFNLKPTLNDNSWSTVLHKMYHEPNMEYLKYGALSDAFNAFLCNGVQACPSKQMFS